MKVHITTEDIQNGLPKNSNTCPLALAMYKIDNMIYVCVGRHSIEYRKTEDQMCQYANNIKLENKIQYIINTFDEVKQIQPFTININTKTKEATLINENHN